MTLFEDASPAAGLVARFSDLDGCHADLEASDDHTVWISWIERLADAPAGAGAKVLTAMGEYADQHGVTLELRVAPDEEAPVSPLVAYYEKLGFEVTAVDDDPFGGHFMRRRPRHLQVG